METQLHPKPHGYKCLISQKVKLLILTGHIVNRDS